MYVAGLGSLPPLLTITGLGDGALLDALDRSGWSGRVVAFEPHTELLAVLRAGATCRRWLDADRLRIVAGPDYRGGVDACLAFQGELRALAEPSFAERYPDATRQALDAMKRAVRSVRANAESKRRHADIYRRNTLLNARTLAGEGNVAALSHIAVGAPAIVVAAGPSLDRQLGELRDVQDRAVVISVDTALRSLLAAGIRPHFAVAVDSTSTNAMHLTDLSRAESTWLIAEGSIDPHALAAFRGRIFGCRIGRHDPWPWLEERGLSVGQLRAWGSVVTTAFDLAVYLGASTVAFAGLDLAFTGGRPYCRGTAFEESWRRIQDWGTPLPIQWTGAVEMWTRVDTADVHGRLAHTSPHLVAFRDWLIEQATGLSDTRIVNTTGAGILHGTDIEQASLASLARHWPPLEVRSLIQSAWSKRLPISTAIGELPEVEADSLVIATSTVSRPEPTWRQADPVTMDLVRMTIPRSRIHPRDQGRYGFAFRTRAARRWMAQRLIGEPRLFEDETLVGDDAFTMTLDEITFTPSSAFDPRVEGPRFSLEIPSDIANYESLPLDFVLDHGL